MSYQHIEYRVEAEARAAVITLNRPEVRNALNQGLMEECLAAVQAAMAAPVVRSLILTGKGDRAFAAGADIEELRRRDHMTETGAASITRRSLTRLLETGPKPTIAAINGHAVGGGLELALACTLRLAVSEAKLGLGEINLGILPGNGATQRLVHIAGLGRAMELVLTGQLITGSEAQAMGIVNRVVSLTDLMPTALQYAALFAGKSARALRAAKETVMMACEVPLSAGLEYENKWFAILNSAPDKAEGVDAFLARRPARFADDPT